MSVPASFEDSTGTIRFEGHIEGTGLTDQTATNVGAVIVLDVPLRLGASGPTIQAGAGVPAVGGNVGDIYINKSGSVAANTAIYGCTVAGGAGAATWVAAVTS